MADERITVNLAAETTMFRLGLCANAVSDPPMRRLCEEAANAWASGDRGPLVQAVVALVDDLTRDLPGLAPLEVTDRG